MVYHRFILSLSLLLAFSVSAKQFIYPVGATIKDGAVTVHLMHQKSLEDLELLAWNPVTKVTTKELLSTFIPALFRILPLSSGFSFIDKDRILVKSFKKRSPKTIAFNDPIDEIAALEWIDESHFYFMAKRGNRFCVFQSNLQGDLCLLAQHDEADCMYPQKVGGTLFYVERAKAGEKYVYTLVSAPYPKLTSPSVLSLDSPEDREIFLRHEADTQPLITPSEQQRVLSLNNKPVAFLHMVSDTQGFFVTHPQTIKRDDPLIPFTYCELVKAEGVWHAEPLFNFNLPAHFFVSPNEFRLYESLLPFLPKVYNSKLYFADCYDTGKLRVGLFAFDLAARTITKASYTPEQDTFGDIFFAPLQVHSRIFYGGILSEESPSAQLPAMWINEDGLLCVDLPRFACGKDFEA